MHRKPVFNSCCMVYELAFGTLMKIREWLKSPLVPSLLPAYTTTQYETEEVLVGRRKLLPHSPSFMPQQLQFLEQKDLRLSSR